MLCRLSVCYRRTDGSEEELAYELDADRGEMPVEQIEAHMASMVEVLERQLYATSEEETEEDESG